MNEGIYKQFALFCVLLLISNVVSSYIITWFNIGTATYGDLIGMLVSFGIAFLVLKRWGQSAV